MKKKLFGAVIAPISILGLTFALGLGTTAFGTVGDEGTRQTLDDLLISTLDVTTEIPVAPWCGWYVSTDDTTARTLTSTSSGTLIITFKTGTTAGSIVQPVVAAAINKFALESNA